MKTKLGVYWTLGDLGMDNTLLVAKSLLDSGVDLLELGLPFSDPLLDGPLIQASHHRITAAGVTFAEAVDALEKITALAKAASAQVSLMTASQLIYEPSRRAQLPPLDAILVTDISSAHPTPFTLPSPRAYFVSQEVVLEADYAGLPKENISMIYLTRVQGITGEGQQASDTSTAAVARLRMHSSLPIWLGFGLSNPKDLAACGTAGADGGIIGSAFVRHVQQETARLSASQISSTLGKLVSAWVGQYRHAIAAEQP
jgi:tryptophan synthase alpha chain